MVWRISFICGKIYSVFSVYENYGEGGPTYRLYPSHPVFWYIRPIKISDHYSYHSCYLLDIAFNVTFILVFI